jgi:hypothetical protein
LASRPLARGATGDRKSRRTGCFQPRPSLILQEHEWQALYCTIHQTPTPPEKPPIFREAGRWIAQLGGFLACTGDGEPGVQTLWHSLAGSATSQRHRQHLETAQDPKNLWVTHRLKTPGSLGLFIPGRPVLLPSSRRKSFALCYHNEKGAPQTMPPRRRKRS